MEEKIIDNIEVNISEGDIDREWWNMIMEDIGIIMQQYGITPKMLINIAHAMMEEE